MPHRYSDGDQTAEVAREAEGRLVGLPGLIGAPVAAPPGLPMGGPPEAEEGDGEGEGGRGEECHSRVEI